MELLHLIVRTASFAASLWILLEFIVTCKVKNKWGLCLVAGLSFLVVLTFFLTKQSRLETCTYCKGKYLKPLTKSA